MSSSILHGDYIITIFEFFSLKEVFESLRYLNKHWNKLSHSYIQKLIYGCKSGDYNREFASTKLFRQMLSVVHSPPIQQIIQFGIVPKFVEFLQRQDQKNLVFEAAWVLTNIASGNKEQTQLIIDLGSVPIFVQLLKSHPDLDVREQAIWALGNIAGNGVKARDLLLKLGIMNPLIEACQPKGKLSMQKQALWTLSNIWREKPRLGMDWVQASLNVIVRVLNSVQDMEILEDVCWTISYMTDDDANERIEAFVQTGSCKRIIDLMIHSPDQVRKVALRIIGNVVTGTDMQTQAVINAGGLGALKEILMFSKLAQQDLKEVCWTISNITAGSTDQIQAVIDAEIFPFIFDILKREESDDVHREAVWVVSNAAAGGFPEQIEYLVKLECIPIFFNIISNSMIQKTICVALEGMQNILRMDRKYAQQAIEIEAKEKLEGLSSRSFYNDISQRVTLIQSML